VIFYSSWPGFFPAIHVFLIQYRAKRTLMAGTSSAKTRFTLLPGHDGSKKVKAG
jgi:hypothetical protein